jgi:Putative prokaryotic signal transducing protein
VTTSVLTVVSSEPEAEMICGLLRSADIACDHRATQSGVKFGGPHEVLVRPEDFEAAQSLLAES